MIVLIKKLYLKIIGIASLLLLQIRLFLEICFILISLFSDFIIGKTEY